VSNLAHFRKQLTVLLNKVGEKMFEDDQSNREQLCRRGLPFSTVFFHIKDGHRLVDPSGQNLKDDAEAIDKAKTLAVGVSLDKPAVDPLRRLAVRDDSGREVFSAPVIQNRQLPSSHQTFSSP
jgi:hypothetical protein